MKHLFLDFRIGIMKCILKLLLLFCCMSQAIAQSKYDYNWVICRSYSAEYEGSEGVIFRFSEDNPVQIDTLYVSEAYMFREIATMSDVDGNLLFYTDGCGIYNRNHIVMDNGWDVNNVNSIYDDYCPGGTFGQGNLMILPDPGNDMGYYMIHKSSHIGGDPLRIYSDKLMYTYVDMTGDNGLGSVTLKNQILEENIEFRFGHLIANKHSNGSDWWFKQLRIESNMYYKYILDEQGIALVDSQAVGPTYIEQSGGATQVTYSRDGSLYFCHDYTNGLIMYSFDKANAHMEYIDSLKLSTKFGWRHVAISPNDRFLYASNADSLFQIDLNAPSLADGVMLIDTFDGFTTDSNIPVRFSNYIPGPDCKLYLSTPAGISYMHTIHAPDEKGKDCDFRQHDITLPFGAPPSYKFVMPFYRTDEAEPCHPSTVGLYDMLKDYQPDYQIFPNPVSDKLQIVSPDRSIIAHYALYDINGNRLASDSVQDYRLMLDMSEFVSGIYLIHLYDKDANIWIERVVRI